MERDSKEDAVRVNLLNILFFCVLIGMILYMVKDVRDAWKLSPKRFSPGVRFVRCVLLAFFYVLPFILTIIAPFGYGFHAFILGIIIAILPIYFIMKPVWAVRPFESLLRKRYHIKQAPRKRKPPVDSEENPDESVAVENKAAVGAHDGDAHEQAGAKTEESVNEGLAESSDAALEEGRQEENKREI